MCMYPLMHLHMSFKRGDLKKKILICTRLTQPLIICTKLTLTLVFVTLLCGFSSASFDFDKTD
jgi:hypothetical protein